MSKWSLRRLKILTSLALSIEAKMTEIQVALTSAPLSEFTKFPEFPTELRLKIWAYSARTPRLLTLQYCIVDRKFFSFQNLPAILHTSQESRAVGLHYYHLSFGTDKHSPGTYFNTNDDIIYFGSEQYDDEIDYMVRYFENTSTGVGPRDQIRNLALAEYLWRRDYHYSPFASRRGNWAIQKFSRTFPHLNQLIYVKGPKAPFDGGEESEEHVVSIGSYAGPSLIKSGRDPDLARNPNLALDAVMSLFQAGKQESGTRRYPEVTVMEFRCS
jgi:2EXR family